MTSTSFASRAQRIPLVQMTTSIIDSLNIISDYIVIEILWLATAPGTTSELIPHTAATRIVRPLTEEEIEVQSALPNFIIPYFQTPAKRLEPEYKFLFF